MLIELAHWHPIFVHFTFSLLFLAPFFLLAAATGRNHDWGPAMRIVGRGLLWTGVLISVLTLGAGFIAMWNVRVSEEVHHHIHDHRNWALATASAYVVLALWSFIDWRRNAREGGFFLLLLFGALGMLLVTGYKGGELVFHHGVSVEAAHGRTDGPGGAEAPEHSH